MLDRIFAAPISYFLYGIFSLFCFLAKFFSGRPVCLRKLEFKSPKFFVTFSSCNPLLLYKDLYKCKILKEQGGKNIAGKFNDLLQRRR